MTARSQIYFWIAAAACFFALLYLFRDILLPFLAGAALAYFLDPAADRLERWRLPRSVATVLLIAAFLAFFVALFSLIFPVIQAQLVAFAARLPRYVEQIRSLIDSLSQGALGGYLQGHDEDVRRALGKVTEQSFDWLATLAGNLLSGGAALFNILSLLLITPVVTFFLLRDWDKIVVLVDRWLPKDHAPAIRAQVTLIDQALAGFARGQALSCFAQGALYAIGWSAIGLEFGLVLGLVTGILAFIPYAGTTFGFLVALLIGFGQFWPSVTPILLIVAVHLAVQIFDQVYLTPRLIGESVSLHPVWVLFALLAGGSLLGFVGVLVAIPVAAVIGVLVRFAIANYTSSRIYLGAGAAAASQEETRL